MKEYEFLDLQMNTTGLFFPMFQEAISFSF